MTHPASTPRRAWLIWGVGLATYLVAVFHRSSLAVAGLAASERFGISASALATFTMLQLLVYAGMQVPVGLLVDRFGPRRVLTVGIVVISLAQVGFAFAESYPAALAARTFVGVGDAMTFVSVLRLVSAWFSPFRIPLVTQLTGSTGQLGAIAAAVPMTWALDRFGWTPVYLSAGGLGVILFLALIAYVGDTPTARTADGPPIRVREVAVSLRASWSQPGTRLAFWAHFSTPFSANMVSLLWGFPFLVLGEGASDAVAGTLISVIVISSVTAGPVLGWLVSKHAWHRSTLVLTSVTVLALTWGVVLLWPGPAPVWLLVLLMIAVGFGGPTSMIAFDLARTSNPPQRLATATGLVNQGGFIAALIAVLAVGWVLDARTPGDSTDYSPATFHAAMSVQYLLWALGAFQIWRYRRMVRRLVPRGTVDQGSTMVELSKRVV